MCTLLLMTMYVRFVDFEVCDLTTTVSPELILSAHCGTRTKISLWTSSSCPQVVGALKPDSSFHIMTNYPTTRARERRIWPQLNSAVCLGWWLTPPSSQPKDSSIYRLLAWLKFQWQLWSQSEFILSSITSARGWGFVNILSVVMSDRLRDFMII